MPAGAYEVMLVLRGRSYLTADLARAGRDIRRLSTVGQIRTGAAQTQLSMRRATDLRRQAAQQLMINRAQRDSVGLQRQGAAANLGITRGKLKEAGVLKEVEQRYKSQLMYMGRMKAIQEEIAVTGIATPTQLNHLDVYGKTVNALSEDMANLSKAAGVNTGELAANSRELEKSNEAAIKAGEGVRLAAQKYKTASIQYRQTMDIGQQALSEAAMAEQRLPYERISAYGTAVEHVGRTLQTFGLIAVAAFGYAAHAAAKFETESTLAATQMITRSNNSVLQIQRTGAAISAATLKFMGSGKSVLNAADITGLAYQIPSGIPTLSGNSMQKARETIAIIKELNQVVTANFGLVTATQAGDAAIIMVNTFHTAVSQLPAVFDMMQSAVNRGKVTMGEFISGLSQTAPAALSAGYSITAMDSTLSFLSGKLPQYTRVAVGYARAIDLFHNIKLQDYFKAHGAPITDATGKLKSYVEIIKAFVKVFPDLLTKHANLMADLKKAMGSVSTQQARRVLTPSFLDIPGLERATKEVPAHAKGLVNATATALSQTGLVQWQKLTVQFQALAIELGRGAIPMFKALAKPLEAVMKWFNHLSPGTQKLIGEIGAAVAAGTLLAGVFMTITGAAMRLYAAIGLKKLAGGGGIFGMFKKAAPALGAAGEVGTEAAVVGEVGGGTAMAAALGGPLIAVIPLLIIFHKQVGEVVKALGGLKTIITAIGIGMVALTIARTVTEIAGIGAAATVATGEVGILDTALLALGGPEVLAALAATAAALFLLIALRAKSEGLPGTKAGSPAATAGTLIKRGGKYYALAPGAGRSGGIFRPHQITIAEAEAKYHVNIPTQGIDKAIKDSPRYQHVIGANKAAINAIMRQRTADAARIRAANEVAGITGGGGGTTRTINQWIAVVNAAQKSHELDPTNLVKAKRYEAVQAALNSRFKDQPALLAAINDVLGQYNTNLGAATSSAGTLGTTFNDVLSAMQSKLDNFVQTEQGIMGTLFQGPYISSPLVQNRLQWGGQLSGMDLLKDTNSQLKQSKTFHADLNKLSRQGAPSDLIQQLLQLGSTDPKAAIERMQELQQLNPKQLKQYFDNIRQMQKMEHQYAMADLKAQLKDYMKYGKSVALAIITGLQSENPAMTAALTNLIHNMFPGLPVGAPGAGGKPGHKVPKKTGPTSPPPPSKTTKDSGQDSPQRTKQSINYNIHIHGEPTHSQMSKAELALFNARNKFRH